MIQVRNSVFETNSSSSHCLTVMPRNIYDDWKDGKIALSIRYIYNENDAIKYDSGFNDSPIIGLPENFNDKNHAVAAMNERSSKYSSAYDYENLRDGDNGFMRNWGNFNTYAPIVRSVSIENQKEENLKFLQMYIDNSEWYIEYLKEDGRYDMFIGLIEQYKETGKFTKEMYSMFPDYMFFTADEYYEMLPNTDCHSPFIHVFEQVVALGYYFHS